MAFPFSFMQIFGTARESCEKLAMSTAADSQRFAVDQVRELLAVDRRGAGEMRQQELRGALRTAAFKQPIQVRVKRRWRLDRSLRRRVTWSVVLVVLTLAVCLFPWELVKQVQTATPGLRALQDVLAAPVVLPPSALVDAAEHPQPGEAPAVTSSGLPPRVRLQRGDLWLRIEGERAAREARELLESGLRELPQHARGQAALAQACLRLADESCARQAIGRAIEARPQRTKFRELARTIERRFQR